jgi:uncharacterized BrkB/YihY/UPF0761 family membrane protein
VALLGVCVVQLGAETYFALLGDANAIYGTLGILLAVVFSAYLVAIVIVAGAHVSAQVSLLPDAAAIEHALEGGSVGTSPGRFAIRALRGLFVRVRPHRDD